MATKYLTSTVNGITPDSTGDITSLLPSKEPFIVDGTNSKTYTIPSGYFLDKIILFPTSNCLPECSTLGGTTGDIIATDGINVTPAVGAVWVLNILAITSKTIVVSTIPAGSTIIFVKIKLI